MVSAISKHQKCLLLLVHAKKKKLLVGSYLDTFRSGAGADARAGARATAGAGAGVGVGASGVVASWVATSRGGGIPGWWHPGASTIILSVSCCV